MTSLIEISCDKNKLDVPFIHAHLAASYWSPNIPIEIVTKAIAHSLCFGVYLSATGQQCGFARVITDFATFGYLADVFIAPEYRAKGFSKQLLAAIQAHPDLQHLRRMMLMTKDAHNLYAQFGFTELANPSRAMEINRPNLYQS